MASVAYGSQPFAEQVAFFRRKLNLPTQSWTDIYTADHDFSFVVAGANRDEIVTDFRAAVDKAISQGTTLEEFRKDFDTIVAKHGWSYNGTRGWRTRVIYDTNLRTSYAAGRYAQMQDLRNDRPYWEFHHTPVRYPREEHVEWDGLVLRADDPWWNTHYPPNGWGCQCVVYTHSAGDLKRMGRNAPDAAPETKYRTVKIGKNGPHPRTVTVPEGIDPGFEYTPGKARLQGVTPPALSSPLPLTDGMQRAADPLPPVRSVGPSLRMPDGLASDDYVRAFMRVFGGDLDSPVFYRDRTGASLLITDQLFRDRDDHLKLFKRGRNQDVLLIAQAITDPDEIWQQWVTLDAGISVLQRAYIARFQVPDEPEPMLAIYQQGRFGWSGVTGYGPEQIQRLERNRTGIRVYRRGDDAPKK